MAPVSRWLLAWCLMLAAAAPACAAQPRLATWSGRAQVNLEFVDLAKTAGGAVVNISTGSAAQRATQSDEPEFMSGSALSDLLQRLYPVDARGSELPSVGSGLVITADGYILTNAHLVAETDTATVRLADRRELVASVVGVDPYTNLALIKIAATGLQTVKLGAAAELQVGEWVAAMGSPFGFENSITAGIVSAVGRYLPNEAQIPFIQTDVAVNPGNSGGPLFNLRGEVVGVNSMIYSAGSAYTGFSFAVPIEVAMKVAAELLTHGKVSRGRLGVRVQDVTAELAASFRMKERAGALVVSTERAGPADLAGLRAGDIVIGANGKAIQSAGELLRIVAGTPPGAAAGFEVWRRGAKTNVTAVMGELGRIDSGPSRKLENGRIDALGLTLIQLTAREREELDVEGALLVQNASGPARIAGIRKGDIILAINDAKLERLADLERELKAMARGSSVALLVARDDNRAYVAMILGD